MESDKKCEIAYNLDGLHTVATSLGYSIEKLLIEEDNAKSPIVKRYKQICREDLEQQLDTINRKIREL